MADLKGVLLDTGFLIRLVNANDPEHDEARKYFEFCQKKEIPVFLPTIAMAEYCIKGNVDEIPLDNLRVLPFNAPEAVRAGQIGRIAFQMRREGSLPYDRKCLKDDVKILAQATLHNKVSHILVFDNDFITLSNHIKQQDFARSWRKPVIINVKKIRLSTLLGELNFE